MNEIRAAKRLDNQLPEELVSDRDGTVQRFDSALVAPPSRRFGSPTRVLELDGHAPGATELFLRDKPKRIFTKLSILVAVLLALFTLALYWPVVHFDFVHYDDNDYVFDNQNVRAGLTWWGVVWSFVDAHALNWHPVTWLSHMLDCQLFGLNPGAHHLVTGSFLSLSSGRGPVRGKLPAQ